MNKLKVLHVIGSLNVGGAEKQLVNLLSALDRERFEIFVWCTSEKGPLAAYLETKGIRVQVIDEMYVLSPFSILKQAFRMRRERFHIVHTHLFYSSILGRVAARLVGIPLIVHTLHAPFSWKQQHDIVSRTKTYADRILCNHLTDVLLPVSRFVGNYHTEVGGVVPHKMIQINNCVNTEEFADDQGELSVDIEGRTFSTDDPIVINIARLDPIKGHHLLINAAKRVISETPEVKFLIVGDGPEMSDIERRVREEDLMENVILTGERLDIKSLLRISRLFVLSSMSEGIPITILEAMASGLPVVATAVGGLPDIVRENQTGFLVPKGDAEALSEKILTLLRDPGLRERFGRNARELVRSSYDSKAVAKRLEEVYLSHLTGRGIKDSGVLRQRTV